MAWKGESRRHSLARKGIVTANGQIQCISKQNMYPTMITAYHGSPIKDITISELKMGLGAEFQRIAGIYFTKNPKIAEDYTKIKGITHPDRILKVKIVFKNPATRKTLDEIGYRIHGFEMREKLIQLGYDGVIDDFMDEVVVFYPEEQIKEID